MESASNAQSRAWLLAATSKEVGTWLNSFQSSSLCLQMYNDTVCTAVGLRLGSYLCRPHPCSHCGVEVEDLGTHDLCCWKCDGHHHSHAAVNDLLHRAQSAAKIKCHLESSGLYRSDGKRPDGVSVVPWKDGKLLVWNVTCPDTFVPSYCACTWPQITSLPQ